MMTLRNSSEKYGLVSIILHWIVAIAIFGMFALGLWMVTLSYYDTWYHQAPYIHKSLGILIAIAMISRVLWRFISPPPPPLSSYSTSVKILSRVGHLALYTGIFVILISGYLISTADHQPIDVFGWFSIPAIITGLPNQADLAGKIHLYTAWLICLAAVAHALIALKHHFIDKDSTLKRMLGHN